MSTYDYIPSSIRLLDEVVRALIERNNITAEELQTSRGVDCRVWKITFKKACRLKPEALGRIACAVPAADLYGWHRAAWLGESQSGQCLVQQIATTAMICHMEHLLGVRTYQSLPWVMPLAPELRGPVPAAP